MAREEQEQTEELFDFLYRDSSRLISLYAQIFGGHLISYETTDQTRTARENTGEAKASALAIGVGGSKKLAEETLVSARSVLDPHDIRQTDVLRSLFEANKINNDIGSAPTGSLVHAEGTLVFVDKSMLELGIIAMQSLIEDEKKKRGQEKDREKIKNFDMIKEFMTKLQLPSSFLLRTGGNAMVAGTIKDAGMEESISTYYFKHGSAGLSGVRMVGVKEVPTATFEIPKNTLIGAGAASASALHTMLFPVGSIKVTPLVFFRKL